jgi:tetratricopeptide (TPR) repeat protein
MHTVDDDLLRDAILKRRHALLRARLPAELSLPPGVVGLRARCDGDRRPLGPLRDVALKALRLLGDDRAAEALRARLAGDRRGGVEPVVGALLHALNSLAAQARGPAVLVLDEVGAADEATLDVLTRVVSTPGVLRTSLVLAFGGEPTLPACRALAAAALDHGAVDVTAPFERSGSMLPPDEGAWRVALRDLAPEVVLTLRAAAMRGDAFDVDDLVELREISPLRALEHLQIAREAGFPLDDTGDATMRMPAPVAETLRAGVLPSLARRWHLTLAARSAGPAPAPPSAPRATAPIVDDPAVRSAPPRPRGDVAAPRAPKVPEVSPEAVFVAEAPARRAERPSTRSASVPLPSNVRSSLDGERAAAHLAAAGDLDGAARQLASVLQETAALGFPTRALEHGRHALALLDGLPDSAPRRTLRAELLLMLGTVQWRASGPGEDFSLQAATQTLRDAREALPPRGAADLRARIAGALAGVCGEVGDIKALDEALNELTEATRALQGEGASVEAARLLNDQADVHLRLGDPVKAAWLLRQSREVFAERTEAMADDDPRRGPLLHELAETDHLFGRLTLLARARAGREGDALSLGREHSEAAHALFTQLGAERDAARVRETLGRIEIRAGHPRRAEEHLRAALAAEEAAGDVLGLARANTALAELHAQEGRLSDALARLSDAVAFNLEKGSAQGVAYVRRALEQLTSQLEGAPEAVQHASATLREELAAAETIVGTVDLPGLTG